MSIQEYRERLERDDVIRCAVARAAGPALLDLIESGQRLNDPTGAHYRDMNSDRVYGLVRIIGDYQWLHPAGSPERRRAAAALACGHGYNLTDSCPMCDNNMPPTPGALPLIALTHAHKGDTHNG